MRYIAIGAVLLAGLFLTSKCYEVVGRDAERELDRLGYREVVVEPSALAFCAKGRYGYRFTATRGGRPAKGYVCAGGLFLGPAVRETGR